MLVGLLVALTECIQCLQKGNKRQTNKQLRSHSRIFDLHPYNIAYLHIFHIFLYIIAHLFSAFLLIKCMEKK